MTITVLAFAQARAQLGFAERVVACAPEDTPRTLLARLAPGGAFETMRVALDQEYCAWDTPLAAARELALIPPVSGG
jgi:molybdopterin converting factor small subunit